MKTDSFFYRFFSLFPGAFFVLIGESERKARKYKFTSVEIKEQAFRFDGVFMPESKRGDIRFVEVQFDKKADFYPRLFGEIFLYLRQNLPAGNWRAAVIFPSERTDPGVHRYYREFFESGRLQRIYLNRLPDTLLNRFPLSLLKIIIAPKKEVTGITKEIVKQISDEISNAQQQEVVVELLINLLLQKLKTITREEVRKMVEPMMSDIKKTRFYQEIAEEGREEGRLDEKRQIVRTLLLKKMSTDFIAEVTGLAIEKILEISEQLSEEHNGKSA